MPPDFIASLKALLEKGNDNAALRFALASRYLEASDAAAAALHAEQAVRLDPEYSAAWKLLGRAQAAAGAIDDARRSYERGIEVAERRGDRQAANEMRVFKRRLDRERPTRDEGS